MNSFEILVILTNHEVPLKYFYVQMETAQNMEQIDLFRNDTDPQYNLRKVRNTSSLFFILVL